MTVYKNSEARRKANLKYIKKSVIRTNVSLNKNTDADVVDWLERHPKKQTTIKKALRIMMNLEESLFNKQYLVEFSEGKSRIHPNLHVSYMVVVVDALDDKGNIESTELYAEMPSGDSEVADLEILKEKILQQAKDHNLPLDILIFPEIVDLVDL